MRRTVIATLTICIFFTTLLGGQLAFAAAPHGSCNVRDFGAKGDGVTNDTVAIQAAINALTTGSTLYFPAGTYVVKAPKAETYAILPLTKKNIRVMGDGIGVSTIKVADACPTYTWLLGPDDGSAAPWDVDLSGMEICDLTFDHNIDNNPITNLAEITNYPEYTCGTMHGNDVYFHDFEVINASSYVNIHHGDWGNDATNITVERITCSGIGDDPNHIVHDASFINVKGTGLTVVDCDLSCDAQQLPGGVTAMEVHGSNSVCQNNTITNFAAGILPCGMSRWPVTNFLVDSNTISGCNSGIVVWSNKYDTHITGYGVDGMTISNNDIDLVQADVAGVNRVGIFCNAQNDLDINDLTITANNITMPLETVGSGRSYSIYYGAIGYVQDTTHYTLSNSSITNNTINNFPMNGIRFRVKLDNVSITDNTLTDCGSTTQVPLPYFIYRSPMFFEHIETDTLDVSNNTMIDDIAVTRTVSFVSNANDISCTGMTLSGNSFSATGDKVKLGQQIYVNDDITVPLITGSITGFVHPTHKVDAASIVIDGIYSWVVKSDRLSWVKTITTPPSTPTISSISPTSGVVGSSVTLTGTRFCLVQGTSYVSFGSVKATEYTSWSDTQVVCKVPSGASGSLNVTLTTGDGTSNSKSFKVVPQILRISPTSGNTGTPVTVTGTGFGNSQGGGKGDSGDGSSTVTFNRAQASNCSEWSDTEIKAVVPQSATTGPVVIVVGGSASNADKTLTVTRGSSFYFAEGYTGENFAEWLCMGNPNNTAATATVIYIFSDSTIKNVSYDIPANSRYTVNVNSEVGPNREVSMRVLSETANLVAERPIYFNYNGVCTGGSDAVGAASPAKNWYFAEGSTLDGFDQYVTVLNPGSTPANLIFHYMVEGQGEVPISTQVKPNTRATFKTRDQIGSSKNVSLYLESDKDLVAERPMYFDYQGLAQNNWTGGHDVVGANSPAKNWYFAEGTTRSGFEQWLTMQNPTSSPITVSAIYMLGTGQGNPVQKSYTVPAKQRLTVPVNTELGPDKDCSVHLSSSSDFIAERSMYFNYNGVWDGGHDVLGANTPATTSFFAEGCTRDSFEEWICLQNPGSDTAHVTITCYPTSGTPINKHWTVSPNSRLTVNINNEAGANLEISTKVSSDKPIITERPMYFNYDGKWTGGHDVAGFQLAN